jgi:diguanylate cyclase (GGDEF)-like protein
VSFRRRLIVTVILIVIVPIGALALLLVQLTGEERSGKADARVAGALPPVLSVFRADLAQARSKARKVARSPQLSRALAGPPAALEPALRSLARSEGLKRLEVRGAPGRPGAVYATGPTVANAAVRVREPGDGQRLLVVSTTAARAFVVQAASLTGMEIFVRAPGQPGAASPALGSERVDLGGALPSSRDISLPSGDYRVRLTALPDGTGTLRLALLGPAGTKTLTSGEVLIGVILGVFVLVALALIVPLLRDLQSLHDRAAAQAITDELTGMSNRRRFDEILARELERAKRFGRPFSLLLLDLDDFKKVNDTHGHLQGDQVLRLVAKALSAESREIDEPARFGGEEFAVALPETDVRGAEKAAERIRTRIASTPISLEGSGAKVSVTVSIGVSGTPDHPRDARTLVGLADEALYQAKREGKNRTVRAAPTKLEGATRT